MLMRALMLAGALAPAAALAQVPAGGEFRVNTYTTAGQLFPDVASDRDGNFVVVWDSDGQDGSARGVFGQRFDAAGAPRGGEFRVNTVTPGMQFAPRIASAPDGDFMVAWMAPDDYGFGVFARRFDAAGAARGSEFQVSGAGTASQMVPALAADGAGNFVVVWAASSSSADLTGIFGRRVDSSGALQGAEFRADASTTSTVGPAVASDPAGNFVVVWQGYYQGGSDSGVFGQRFAPSGAPRGGEFRVNTYTTALQSQPTVACDGAGNCVVAWDSVGQFTNRDIVARRFDSAGIGGPEFRVSTSPYGTMSARVAADAAGAFVIAWASFFFPDGSAFGVAGRRFDAAGAPRGGEFRVNTYTTSYQMDPAIALDAAGNFVVAWNSAHDGSSYGVFAQRFGGLLPADLAVDTEAAGGNDNGVLEPGETVDVGPAWRNVNGAAQSFTGTLGPLTGPAGAVYTTTDASGLYGTVVSGITAPCFDCYAVSVSAPATRPAIHWDAAAVESLAPDALGQTKPWALHVGASFTDVPLASPFYPFIETLLHHSVTGGCSATEYCPASPTPRSQMAVFALVAREGAGYVPPPCGATPMFPDVPPASLFCRWIEELARRGVVGGCGGGNYCPASPVTRAEMAVFVLATLDPTFVPPACAPPNTFDDVSEASGFCPWIEELARRGVVTGCGGTSYCPASPVTRAQMGVFVSATFGLSLYGP
jgi:hypothetical protein